MTTERSNVIVGLRGENGFMEEDRNGRGQLEKGDYMIGKWAREDVETLYSLLISNNNNNNNNNNNCQMGDVRYGNIVQPAE